MGSRVQLNLPPMAVQEVGSQMPSPAKKVGSTPLVDVAVRAFVRCQRNNQQAAGELGITPTDFSKAFSVNWPERNSIMKKWDSLPFEVRREFAAVLAADYELTTQDSEPVRVLRDLHRVLKAVSA